MKHLVLLALIACLAACQTTPGTDQSQSTAVAETSATGVQPDADGWYTLFNGENLDGWKFSEDPGSFSVDDGMIVVNNKRSHLFYDGPVENHDFTNFEFQAEVMTQPGANSGIYFHTEFQQEGWPAKGYEIQVNNSHTDWRRTGSIYAIQDLKEVPTKDNEWYTEYIRVEGKNITVKLNGETVNEFTEPSEANPDNPGRRIASGTFCLQAHDPNSVVYYRNIRVRPLP
jgi:hypothetical protein